jgi:hypothetical protein
MTDVLWPGRRSPGECRFYTKSDVRGLAVLLLQLARQPAVSLLSGESI